ncbi:MAG: hypothetical protein K8S14_05470 [Actinomycetia bacterium]|nr:hypothetical protein [Actinomycetes bacterium]
MNNLERVKKTFMHKKIDKVPFFELSLNNNVLKDVLNLEGAMPNASGLTRIALFKNLFNNLDGRFHLERSEFNKKIGEFILESTKNLIELYKALNIEMIPFRPYDFLVAPFYRNYLGFSEDINDINISIGKGTKGVIKWRIENSKNFWAEYQYEEKQDTVFMINDCIREKGEAELLRFIKYSKEIISSINIKQNLHELKNSQFYNVIKYYELVKECRDNTDFFSVGYASIPYPSNSTFHPLFLELMITKPSIIMEYFEVAMEEVLNLAKIQIRSGINAIIDVTDWCYNSGPMFSPDFTRKFISPYLKKIVDLCHENNVSYIKHLDGNINSMLEILINEIGIDGLHAIEATAGVDIKEIKKKYGDRITLIGNVDCSKLLISGSKREIFKEVKDIIENISKGGGYILCSSNSIHNGIPTKNFLYMLEARKIYGNL